VAKVVVIKSDHESTVILGRISASLHEQLLVSNASTHKNADASSLGENRPKVDPILDS
jgi:hypothetical protein